MVAGRIVRAVLLPLALRHLVRRRRLAVVALLSLACGVATIAATQLLYGSVVGSYEETMRRFAGRAALEVTNGDSGVPEELADELREIAGVRIVAASVEGFVATPDLPGERLYLYGVDLLADQEMRDYGAEATAVVSDPMVFLAAADSVALTGDFLAVHGLAMHDHIRVLAPAGSVELTIRAILGKQDGPATVLDGRLAVVDLSVAQRLLRLDRRVSQLAIEVVPGADVGEVARRVASRVGFRGTVDRPRARAATFARLLTNYRNGLVLAAALAMLVATQFVANAAAIAVEERRREMALLRLVGAPSRGAMALVVAELFLVALAATTLGVPLGVGLSRVLLARFGAGVAVLYGDIGAVALRADVATLVTSAVVGIGMPLGAAIGPIRRALSIGPLEALRARDDVRETNDACRGAFCGAVIVAAALLLWALRTRLPLAVETTGMATMLGVLAGIACALPAGVRALAAASGQLARRRGEPLALLAARHVAAERRRIAITCAAMSSSIAGTIAVAAWMSSLDATLHEAFDAVFARVDLVVSGGSDPFASEAIRLPGYVANELRQWPDVAFADAARIDTIAFAGSRAAIVARDSASSGDAPRRLYMVEGDAHTAGRELAAGTSVVVNRAFARRFGHRPGDVLELVTPEGLLRVRIAGIHLELTPGDLGAIQIDRRLYRRWWRDDSVSLVEVALRRGADRARVIDDIRARWGERHGIVVFTVEALRRTYRAMLDRLAMLVAPLLAAALACALVGVLSTGAAAVIVRRRTYGVLRAVGITRAQLARATSLELATIGGIAAVAAVIVGAALGWLQVEVLLRGMLGMAVQYAYPQRLALAAASAVIAITALGGWMLGRKAARVPIAEALQWE